MRDDIVASTDLALDATFDLLARCRTELLIPAFGAGDLVDDLQSLRSHFLPERPRDVPEGLMVVAGPTLPALTGCLLAELFPEAAAWIVTHVAVAPAARRTGLGRRMLERSIEATAQRLPVARDALLFAETEHDDGSPGAASRYWFLATLGFRRLDVRYVQPALASHKAPVADLHLLVNTGADAVPAARLAEFLEAYYRAIAGPRWRDERALRPVLATIAGGQDVRTLPLI